VFIAILVYVQMRAHASALKRFFGIVYSAVRDALGRDESCGNR
jgi:hypothetical protein